jgi:hypothetical protein
LGPGDVAEAIAEGEALVQQVVLNAAAPIRKTGAVGAEVTLLRWSSSSFTASRRVQDDPGTAVPVAAQEWEANAPTRRRDEPGRSRQRSSRRIRADRCIRSALPATADRRVSGGRLNGRAAPGRPAKVTIWSKLRRGSTPGPRSAPAGSGPCRPTSIRRRVPQVPLGLCPARAADLVRDRHRGLRPPPRVGDGPRSRTTQHAQIDAVEVVEHGPNDGGFDVSTTSAVTSVAGWYTEPSRREVLEPPHHACPRRGRRA